MAVSTYRIVLMVALAVLAGGLLLAAVVLLIRGNASAPVEVYVPTPAAGSPRPASSPSHTRGTPSTLYVYVSGAVRNPGVYALQSGDRLLDALTAAGGPAEDADLSRVNLARRVQDGEHHPIPKLGEATSSGSVLGPDSMPTDGVTPSDASVAAVTAQGLINLNTASVELLLTLASIGPVRAKAIIDYRERNGPFRSVAEITDIPGIGPITYENIRHLLTVEGTP
jgi:competence protein ComEA